MQAPEQTTPMPTPSIDNNGTMQTERRLPWWLVLIEIALIFFVFLTRGATPVPEVNEPYYIGKAAHFWNAGGPESDPFLDSADSHLVFYITCGWLTLLFTPTTVCWIGRIVTWLLMAWSWRRLSYALAPLPFVSVVTAALVVFFRVNFHMAGEWIIGGFEAKGFAFVLVFLAMEAIVRGRWCRVWPLLGAASAIHVLVGGWTTIAAAVAWLILPRDRRTPLKKMWPYLLAGFCLSLPGLIPALLLTVGTEREIVDRANQIYVFLRFPHHLIPLVTAAGGRFVTRFALLTLVYVLVRSWMRRSRWAKASGAPTERFARFDALVGATIVILIGGMTISLLDQTFPRLAASLLRFYWFRLPDVMIPIASALTIGALLVCLISWSQKRWQPAAWIITSLVSIGTMTAVGFEFHYRWNSPPQAQKIQPADQFVDICKWIAQSKEIPKDARFFTPFENQTFRWYTGRSEVAIWKDTPQDARSMIEWWNRLEKIYGENRHDTHLFTFGNYTPDQVAQRLKDLGHRYDAQYVLTYRTWPSLLPLPIEHSNERFVIYRLTDK